MLALLLPAPARPKDDAVEREACQPRGEPVTRMVAYFGGFLLARAGMKPHYKLAETTTPNGGRLTLHEHDGQYCIRLDGQDLMHSFTAASEIQLGEIAADRFSGKNPANVLIAGLGLGFTLKAVLAKAGPNVVVEVAELMPAVVSWNREHLSKLNGALLSDPRVRVREENVVSVIAKSKPGHYDAILLDIDNGPNAMVEKNNGRLYDRPGIERMNTALKPDGKGAIWSAREDPAFATRLAKAGFAVQVIPSKLYATAKRSTYTIYLVSKSKAAA